MIDNRSVGCNWLSIMKLQPIPNPSMSIIKHQKHLPKCSLNMERSDEEREKRDTGQTVEEVEEEKE